VPGRAALLPRLWSDPYAIAAVLHGAWRVYVVSSGMFYAYTIYASINKGVAGQQLLYTNRISSSRSFSSRGRGPRAAAAAAAGGGVLPPQQQQQPVLGPLQPLRHHLSLSLPVAAGSRGASGGVVGGGVLRGRGDSSLLSTIRERFDKATMVQVREARGVGGVGEGVWMSGEGVSGGGGGGAVYDGRVFEGAGGWVDRACIW